MHHGIFQYCPDLSVVELPESVESVGQTLFSANVHLDVLTLGRNLKYLAFNALGNSSVKDVYRECTGTSFFRNLFFTGTS